MKLSLITSAALAAVLAFPAVAAAQDSGWYIGGNAGGGIHFGNDLSNGLSGDIDGSGSTAVGLNVGYDFGNDWRLELEGSEIFQDAMGQIGGQIGTKASLRTTNYMVNALYDLDTVGKFQPYVGAGIGLFNTSLRAKVQSNSPLNVACTIPGATDCRLADSDNGLGLQGILGADMAITDNLDWTNRLRVFGAEGMSFQGNQVNGSDLNVDLGTILGAAAVTGLVWKFGSAPAPTPPVSLPAPPPPPPAPAPIPEPAPVYEPAPQTYTCSDGSLVYDLSTCAPEPVREVVQQQTFVCDDNVTFVTDMSQCPAPVQQVSNLNVCGPSPVAIFNVDLSATPKPLNRLGTMPEFGDSHDLSPDQFFQKLQAKYAANENGDRAYLNYLFKSMGYAGGFSDAQSYMFSDDVLPVGTKGLLGLGEVHHYAYHVLPNNDRDRQAFRIQSANGTVIHFMKTCGNYMYACEQ